MSNNFLSETNYLQLSLDFDQIVELISIFASSAAVHAHDLLKPQCVSDLADGRSPNTILNPLYPNQTKMVGLVPVISIKFSHFQNP